jgi:integrase
LSIETAAEKAGAAVAMPPPLAARNLGGRPRRVHVWPKREKAALPAAVRKMRKETGKGEQLLAKIVRDQPNDPVAQLNAFFRNFRIPAVTGRLRTVSHKTEERYYKALSAALGTMRELNIRVQNLTELSSKHVHRVTREWESQGKSASALATLNTAFRRFGIWMGKPDLAPLLGTILADPNAGRRSTSATDPKNWESYGVDPEAVFEAMERECPITAMQLRLGWAFGLRVEEQIMFRPQESHKGDTLYISRGTKGGKLRPVKIIHEWEYALIERAKAMAASDVKGNPLGILSPSVRKLKKAMKRYYYLCEKIGLTKAGRFGVTPHGARHSFACRRYQWSSGLPAPVLGGAMPSPVVDTATRLAVSQELGHNRKSASTAYVGTVVNMQKTARAALYRLMERDQLLGSDPVLVRLVEQAAVTTFCLCGPAATGTKLPEAVPVFCEAGSAPVPDAQLAAILQRCAELLDAKCFPISRQAADMGSLETFEILALSRAGMAAAALAAKPAASI